MDTVDTVADPRTRTTAPAEPLRAPTPDAPVQPGRAAISSATPAGPGSAAPAWVHGLVKLMDEAIRIPGTNLRFGWDALLGLLFPGVGDATTAASHVTLIYYAFRARVSKWVLARMLLNVALDTLWGSVPFVGDVFDAGFRANRKNLELIDRNRDTRRGTTWSDYLVVGGTLLAVLAIVFLPVILLLWFTAMFVHRAAG